MGDDKKLGGIEEVLPNNIGCRAQDSERMEVHLRHPDAEGGVLLSESLTGCDGRDTRHRLGSGRRVNEDILVIAALGGGGEVIADELTETELQ